MGRGERRYRDEGVRGACPSAKYSKHSTSSLVLTFLKLLDPTGSPSCSALVRGASPIARTASITRLAALTCVCVFFFF